MAELIEFVFGFFVVFWKPILAGCASASIAVTWAGDLFVMKFGKDEYGE